MSIEDRSEFQADLRRDVGEIYKGGLDPEIQPTAIPGLAELAEALCTDGPSDSSSEYYGNAAENLLHRVMANLVPTALFRTGNKEQQQGLTELFGIGEERNLGRVERRSRAAPYLGYKTPTGGDVLKKATRTINGTKRLLTDLVLDEVVAQLLLLADFHGFSYIGRFRSHKQDQVLLNLTPLEIVSRKDELQVGRRAVQSARLSMTILKELVDLGIEGFSAAVEKRTPQTLGQLAERALNVHRSNPREFPSNALKDLLTWAIERVGTLKGEKYGLKLFFGLDEAQGWTADMRYRKASNFLDFDSEHSPDPIFATPTLLSVLRETRDQIVMLAAEIGFSMSDYWEVDSDIIRMDTDLVRHWQSYAPKPPNPHEGV